MLPLLITEIISGCVSMGIHGRQVRRIAPREPSVPIAQEKSLLLASMTWSLFYPRLRLNGTLPKTAMRSLNTICRIATLKHGGSAPADTNGKRRFTNEHTEATALFAISAKHLSAATYKRLQRSLKRWSLFYE